MKARKAQEEIVGFVLIVVLVAVVFIIFLGILIRQPDSGLAQSMDVQLFLESTFLYTSNCSLDYEPHFATLQTLTRTCFREPEKICTSGKHACEVVSTTLEDLIQTTWSIGEERAFSGYVLNISYQMNVSLKGEKIMSLTRGNCSSGNYIGASPSFSDYTAGSSGSIVYDLRLCTRS